ncbi:MAG: tetratricopeptide repeat protein, partial [bacterium]
QAHSGLGSALMEAGRAQEAFAQYQAAVQLNPRLTSAYSNMGVLLTKQGQLAEARRYIEHALSIDPTYEPARELLASLTSFR